MTYQERQRPSLWLLPAIALLSPAVGLLFYFVNMTLGFIIGAVLAVVIYLLLWFSSPVITVGGGSLQVGQAKIPVSLLGDIETYEGNAAFIQRGYKLDHNAWLAIRGAIDPVLKVMVEDANDPTPYWLVSTRNPLALKAAILAEQSPKNS